MLEGFPVVVRRPVDWGEMDAMQHVNNVAYFRWMESGRAALFERMGILKEGARGVGVILKSVACDYKAPIKYPDDVAIGVRVQDVGVDRFTIAHAIWSERLGKIAARGDGVVVAYDYDAGAKVPVPDAWRALFAELADAA
jgi:acyl-CoA thioester hydrolase